MSPPANRINVIAAYIVIVGWTIYTSIVIRWQFGVYTAVMIALGWRVQSIRQEAKLNEGKAP